MKRTLLLISLTIVLLTGACLGFFLATQPGLQTLISLSNILFSGRIHIASASGSLMASPQINGLRVSDGIDTVTIDHLSGHWQPMFLLQGQLAIDTLHCSGVNVHLGPGSPGNYEPEPLASPLPVRIGSLTVDGLGILDEQEEVLTAARGEIRQIAWQRHDIRVEGLDFAFGDFGLQARGTLQTVKGYPLDLSLAVTAQPEGYSPVSATVTVKGPINALSCEVESITPLHARLTGMVVNLLGETTWQAKLSGEQGQLSQVRQGWPEQPFSSLVIEGYGTFNQYTLSGTTQLAAQNKKEPVELRAQVQGDGMGLRVEKLRLSQGQTALEATGTLGWNPVISWQGEVSGAHLDPAIVFQDWPGDMACTLQTKGTWQDNGPAVRVELDRLQGSLRGYAITGKGKISFADNRLQVPAFSVESGRSSLTLAGSYTDTVDLLLLVNTPNLAEVWPQSGGTLQARFRLHGPAPAPLFALEAKGDGLTIKETSIKHLTARAEGEAVREGLFKGQIMAEGVISQDVTLERVQVTGQGTMARQALAVEMHHPEYSATMQLRGGVGQRAWQGTLEQAHIHSAQLGDWRQEKSAAMSIARDKAGIDSLCLSSSDKANLCLNASWAQPEQQWRLQTALSAFPWGQMAKKFVEHIALEGTLDAEASLQGTGSRLVQGRLTANAANLQMRVDEAGGLQPLLKWRRNVLQIDYEQERLQARLESELIDGSALTATLTGANLPLAQSALRQAPLTGTLTINLNTLAPLTAFTKQTVRFSGQLHGNFGLAGTVSAPHFAGTLHLAQGEADIPQLGIRLKPLTVAVSGTPEALSLQAAAQSGPGTLQAESRIVLDQIAKKGVTLKITGEQFQAMALQGLNVLASPDLNVVLSPKNATVRGTITIPEATITSIDLDETVSSSADVVVVDEEKAGASLASWPLFANLTLVAGDKVRVDSRGLAGSISGSLHVVAQPGRPAVGQGTLRIVDGTFTTYGRKLTIDAGQLFFTGGPLANPGLELRSEKRKESGTMGLLVEGDLRRPELQFYSSPQMDQAVIVSQLLEGEALGGSSREDVGFIGKAATKTGLGGVVPYLQGVKQLTMIDDIKLDSDKGYDSLSLVFGSWLTPKFYVSYGKNLMKESGSFHTSYTLGKGFFLKTETGSSQSGGDIKYEFER